MAEPILSKMWSTSTLDAGAQHVALDSELARLEAAEEQLQLELQADGIFTNNSRNYSVQHAQAST